MFQDRQDAGRQLASLLGRYQAKNDVVVLAIPRGGVVVAKEVASRLDLPLNLIIVRKLPMPDNPESGIGAISEDGTIVWQAQRKLYPKSIVKMILRKQKEEIKRRIEVLRGGKGLPPLKGKCVILIDDGIAMGSTVKAAIKTLKNKGVKKIILAIPVAGESVLKQIRHLVDELICLEMPKNFYAVAQVYKKWYDVSDQEVLDLMQGN